MPALVQMQPRDIEQARRKVDRDDFRAAPRQRLAEQAAAAADIEHARAVQSARDRRHSPGAWD